MHTHYPLGMMKDCATQRQHPATQDQQTVMWELHHSTGRSYRVNTESMFHRRHSPALLRTGLSTIAKRTASKLFYLYSYQSYHWYSHPAAEILTLSTPVQPQTRGDHFGSFQNLACLNTSKSSIGRGWSVLFAQDLRQDWHSVNSKTYEGILSQYRE